MPTASALSCTACTWSAAWVYPPNHGFESKFYYQHPQWRCVSRSGRPVTRMSYAFAGVRNFLLALFREVAERGADGINLGFVRGLPCLLYEQPMIDGFQQLHNQDPRDLPENDPLWLRFKAGVMTEFMRALRNELNQVGAEQGRTIQLSAYVLNNEALNLEHALDPAAWAREGLVDFIIPYPLHNVMDMDIAAFVKMTRGTQCKVYPEVMPRRQSPGDYREKALSFYAEGVDGLAFWDASSAYRVGFKDEWSMVRRLGHKEELAGWGAGRMAFVSSRAAVQHWRPRHGRAQPLRSGLSRDTALKEPKRKARTTCSQDSSSLNGRHLDSCISPRCSAPRKSRP